MRWAFIRPRNNSPYYDPEIQEPLGIEYLAASRNAKGDAVLILDSAISGTTEVKLARRAASFKPDVVGFSVMTAQEVSSVVAIHREIRSANSDQQVQFMAGGNLVSTEPENAKNLLPDDMLLVRGDGEAAIEEVVGDGSCSSGRIHGERVIAGRPVIDLDSLPFPMRPFSSEILGTGWAFNLQGSRGCCGTCRHCASPGMAAGLSNRWRGRSPRNMVDEIERLYRQFDATSFNFVDEDFLGPNTQAAKRAVEFAKELKERRLAVSFGIQVRPDSLSDEIIDTLTDVGLIYVFMGIESDDPEDFRRWGRPWTHDPFRFVTRLRSRGAEVNAGIMLFHSHSTFQGIRRFARKLSEHRLLEYRSAINRQDAMPGSRLYHEAAQAGLIDPGISGPQSIPFVHTGIEQFRRDLMTAIGPLGPPSMEALCLMPPLLSHCNGDSRLDPRRRVLIRIISCLDEAVVETFFDLLDLHEHGLNTTSLVTQMQQKNLKAATSGIKDLVDSRFSHSFDRLREAIRIDTGV